MPYSIRDVLEKTNYFIKYNYVDGKGNIHISYANKNHVIEYDAEKEIIKCDLKNLEMNCPKYVAPTIAHMLLTLLCDHYEYPPEFVCFYLNNNKCANFNFGFFDKDDVSIKAQGLLELYTDIIKTGVQPEHLDLAREMDIVDGLAIVIELYLGISINVD